MSTASRHHPHVERRQRPRAGTHAFFSQLVFSGAKKRRGGIRALLLPVTLALHIVVLAAVVLVPLFTSEELPQPTTAGGILAFFVEPVAAPPPPPPPPAPPKAAAVAVPKVTKVEAPRPVVIPRFVAPIEIPPEIPQPQVAGSEGLVAAPDSGVAGGVEGGTPGGVVGGVPGGVEGGVVGGVAGGVEGGVIAEVPEPEPPPSAPVRVGGKIKEPKKLKNVAPEYPDIAKQARVQGVVVLEAIIDPSGRVDNVRVLRGIPLLNEAAVNAVRRWVYSPTLLNGVPVPVIMTVTVNFTLGP
jgi:periplasmic protein TonB